MAIKNFEAIFNDSYERVLAQTLAGKGFFDHFYDVFIAYSEEIAQMFVNTDMERQKEMLKRSFFHMLNFFIQKTATDYLQKIALMHSEKLKVRPEQYNVWIESLIAAVKKYDSKYSKEVETAWRVVMAPGIEFMRHYADPL